MNVKNVRQAVAGGVVALAAAGAGAQPGVIVNGFQVPLPPADLAVVFSNHPDIMSRMSFRRTIGQLVTTAGGNNTDAAAIALVDKWRGMMSETSFNNQGVTLPLTPRSEAQLSSADLLNPTSATPMLPQAVTYRFDQISLQKTGNQPITALDCGEVRATYAMGNGINTLGRMTWIFEAKVPNPDPQNDPKGCLPLVNKILSLGTKTSVDQADTVERMLYVGTGNTFGPIIDFNNYKGATNKDGSEKSLPSGQIRFNLFIQNGVPQPWMLRESHLAKLPNGTPTFETQTVASTPFAKYWSAPAVNEAPELTQRRNEFQTYMKTTGVQDLTAIENKLSQKGRENIEDANFLTRLSFPLPRKFAAAESAADGSSSPENSIDQNFRAQLAASIPASPPLAYPVPIDQLLSRVHNAGICAGCHQDGNSRGLAQSTVAGLAFTQPSSNFFVHIREANGGTPANQSQYMDTVLPVREQIMRDFAANAGSFSAKDTQTIEQLANVAKGRTFKPFGMGGAH